MALTESSGSRSMESSRLPPGFNRATWCFGLAGSGPVLVNLPPTRIFPSDCSEMVEMKFSPRISKGSSAASKVSSFPSLVSRARYLRGCAIGSSGVVIEVKSPPRRIFPSGCSARARTAAPGSAEKLASKRSSGLNLARYSRGSVKLPPMTIMPS